MAVEKAKDIAEDAKEKFEDIKEDIKEKSSEKNDPVEALKQLGELRSSGVITEEEFNAKKEELLKRI